MALSIKERVFLLGLFRLAVRSAVSVEMGVAEQVPPEGDKPVIGRSLGVVWEERLSTVGFFTFLIFRYQDTERV